MGNARRGCDKVLQGKPNATEDGELPGAGPARRLASHDLLQFGVDIIETESHAARVDRRPRR
jgi:hypothetical protein